MKAMLACVTTLAVNLAAFAQPVVTNYTTSIYAVVRDPLALSFATDGTLYVGRDASGSGGGSGAAVKIHRVAPGGFPVAEFGDAAISDPDALIVDGAGTVSGTPGAVLVGGVHNNGSTGKIVAVAPDGTVTTLFGPNATVWNPSDFTFDLSGRLLIAEYNNGRVLVTSGGALDVLIALPQAARVAVDALNRVVVSTASSTQLRLYTSDGVLSNANFASIRANSPLARGPGGAWGDDIYAVTPNGGLVRIGLEGSTTLVGSGFLMPSGAAMPALAFGPDGALYVSDFERDRIYRFAQPAVPGAETTIYARVTDPVRLAFAPDGTLFVGRDNTGSGGDFDDAVKIHRVGPGGSPVEEYGDAAITDPDAVAYDSRGVISGTPGSVIVGGQQLNSNRGKIVAIQPDGNLLTLFGPTTYTFNPNWFVFDDNGRLLVTDNEGGKVWVMTNATAQVLANLPRALAVAVDALNRIVLGIDGDRTLQLYSSAGVLLTSAFASAATNSPLARGPGGFWGTGIFCVSTNGDLLSLDLEGVPTKFGTGFGQPWDMAFGPDGALCASDFRGDLIWRISPETPRPKLTAIHSGSQEVTISWNPATPGFVLQESPTLGAPAWIDSPTGETNPVNVPVIPGGKFYRLIKLPPPSP